LYNATAPEFRKIVFGLDQNGVKELAQKAARTMKRLADAAPETHFTLQYSPEVFSGTELEFAKDVCDAVFDIWQPTPDHKAIVNLPATVEMATPNVYADQIEWMHRNLARRDSLIVSVHPHNDRGTAVAAAELAVMAGADRIEGCLFGNGERTGNVDLVTLALNLYTQGVDPGLDFSNINEVARTAEECTQLPVHPRHPYVGDLVFTAFSGSHQDAIKKGLAVQKPDAMWEVPYMPIDPNDLGRTYDSVIRVNSQSGKGGIAYLLEQTYGVVLPRRLQVDFSSAVQRLTDTSGQEVTPSQIWELFQQEYVRTAAPVHYIGHSLSEQDGRERIKLTVEINGTRRVLHGEGNGPLDALMHAMDVPVRIQHYEERALTQGADARAVAVAEMAGADLTGSAFGVGIDANLVTASIRAVISGVNRAYARASDDAKQRFFDAALNDEAERAEA
jgi:2-isopropylmalate synthase